MISEQLQKLVGATLASVLVIAAGLFIALCINPPQNVGAQNSGAVELYTREITVFTGQNTTAASAIFPDYGFAANFLTYCNSTFSGTIDLEWSPTGVAGPFIVLAQASYSGTQPDSSCHVLQVGGYFPNMRSSVTRTAGSVSAWYTASAAPIPQVSSGLGSNGPSSPINCDQNATVTGVATAGTAAFGGVGPLRTGDTVVICGFTWSFQGATSAGTVLLVWSPTNACATPATSWVSYTTASTPQVLPIALQQRSGVPSQQTPCVTNNSGATAAVSILWASVHL